MGCLATLCSGTLLVEEGLDVLLDGATRHGARRNFLPVAGAHLHLHCLEEAIDRCDPLAVELHTGSVEHHTRDKGRHHLNGTRLTLARKPLGEQGDLGLLWGLLATPASHLVGLGGLVGLDGSLVISELLLDDLLDARVGLVVRHLEEVLPAAVLG